ncbi:EamA family transporter [uncultured Oscillibacter sp.]|uniref:EamA family transporter n=1 Tax=uncultured Oscillibacter sp. TaxID=876091 RepID=UPI0025EE22C6|nr:EamA family transporter [uncultured Oscillibacter sp.]
MEMIWPIALVVAANIAYQLCAKAVPKEMDALASLTVTYLVGAACSAALFFFTHRGGSLLQEYAKMNAAPVVLGMSVVGLEVGFIYAYKAGWPVSTASIVQSAFLAVALIFLGALLYREAITVNKLAGAAICLVGLWFLSR